MPGLGSGQDWRPGGLVTSWDRAPMWVPLPHLQHAGHRTSSVGRLWCYVVWKLRAGDTSGCGQGTQGCSTFTRTSASGRTGVAPGVGGREVRAPDGAVGVPSTGKSEASSWKESVLCGWGLCSKHHGTLAANQRFGG